MPATEQPSPVTRSTSISRSVSGQSSMTARAETSGSIHRPPACRVLMTEQLGDDEGAHDRDAVEGRPAVDHQHPEAPTAAAAMRHGSATREMSRAARRTKTTKTATTPSPRTKACHQVRASITTTSAPTAASRGRNMTRLSVRSRPRVFSVCSRLVCSGFVGALTPPPGRRSRRPSRGTANAPVTGQSATTTAESTAATTRAEIWGPWSPR